LAAKRAAMGALLAFEQYCRYWEFDSSSTSSPPQPSMMVRFQSPIQNSEARIFQRIDVAIIASRRTDIT
jgi:hypothetical protein